MDPMDISKDERQFLPFYWLVISVIFAIADYVAGPFIQFPFTYLIPVSLASWYNGRSWGLGLAIVLSVIRLVYNVTLWQIPWSWVEAGINCLIRIVVFGLFAILVDRVARQTSALTREVKMLSGLLPICSFCKRIRDDSGHWEPLERFISQRTEASFSHGVCPECNEKYYGQYLKSKV